MIWEIDEKGVGKITKYEFDLMYRKCSNAEYKKEE